MPAAEPAALPVRVLVAYGLPALPAAMLGFPLVIFLPTAYALDAGLSLAAIGGTLTLARLWDVATDPLVGWLSDRTRTRLGRRRVWLVAAMPVVVVASWFLFQPPLGASAGYLLAWAMAAYLGWTALQVPHQAWGAELSLDYDERNRVMAAREIATVVGVLAAAALPSALSTAGLADAARPEGTALAVLAWAMPPLMLAAGVVMLALVPEPPLRAGARADGHAGWRAGLALLVANRPFRRLLASYVCNGVANGLPASLVILFVGQVLARPDLAGLFLLVYFACGIAGVPLWTALARRIGKHRAWSIAMLYACAVFALVPLLGPGDVGWFMAVCVLNGVAFGADMVLPPSMQADVVDVDTAGGGASRAGLYFALWGMATKLALALAPGIAFVALDRVGFRAEGGNQPAALLTLAALYAWLPVAFKLAAIALLRRYPLTAAAQAELARRIRARPAA